jgi:hypothetical protein
MGEGWGGGGSGVIYTWTICQVGEIPGLREICTLVVQFSPGLFSALFCRRKNIGVGRASEIFNTQQVNRDPGCSTSKTAIRGTTTPHEFTASLDFQVYGGYS